VLTHGFIYHELTTSELTAGLSRKVYVTAKNQYLYDENETVLLYRCTLLN